MIKYTEAINTIDEFLKANPTLTHQRRALGKSGRLASPEYVEMWLGLHVNVSGQMFLDRIHEEIFKSLPPSERGQIETEMESLEHPKIVTDANGKPELTLEYLRSIGREDILEWGTD